MLQPCATCGSHFERGVCACPHCGAKVCAGRRTTAALVLGLALGGCEIAHMEPEYGVAVTGVDDDEDGWDAAFDCDDEAPDVNPDAEEIPGDGVDQNCDGNDDT